MASIRSMRCMENGELATLGELLLLDSHRCIYRSVMHVSILPAIQTTLVERYAPNHESEQQKRGLSSPPFPDPNVHCSDTVLDKRGVH